MPPIAIQPPLHPTALTSYSICLPHPTLQIFTHPHSFQTLAQSPQGHKNPFQPTDTHRSQHTPMEHSLQPCHTHSTKIRHIQTTSVRQDVYICAMEIGATCGTTREMQMRLWTSQNIIHLSQHDSQQNKLLTLPYLSHPTFPRQMQLWLRRRIIGTKNFALPLHLEQAHPTINSILNNITQWDNTDPTTLPPCRCPQFLSQNPHATNDSGHIAPSLDTLTLYHRTYRSTDIATALARTAYPAWDRYRDQATAAFHCQVSGLEVFQLKRLITSHFVIHHADHEAGRPRIFVPWSFPHTESSTLITFLTSAYSLKFSIFSGHGQNLATDSRRGHWQLDPPHPCQHPHHSPRDQLATPLPTRPRRLRATTRQLLPLTWTTVWSSLPPNPSSACPPKPSVSQTFMAFLSSSKRCQMTNISITNRTVTFIPPAAPCTLLAPLG